MTRYFGNLWTREEIELWEEESKQNLLKVEGSYSNRYLERQIITGDVIYVWAYFDKKLFLVNRFTVKVIERVSASSNTLWKSELAVAQVPSPIQFGVAIAPDDVKKLKFMPDGKPPKYRKPPAQNEPDAQTFRGTREISADTAALLDTYFKQSTTAKNVKPTSPVIEACDLQTPPARVKTTVNRIIRDTAMSKQLKKDYGYQCQVCNETIDLGQGQKYAEVHHLIPLGGKHAGADDRGNMLVLCPNHHAMFDFGIPVFKAEHTVTIYGRLINLTSNHVIDAKSIDYYMKSICIG